MSLYHEAAEIVEVTSQGGGSIKSIVFGTKNWKSDRKSLFALCTEAAKWSGILSEVIEQSGILKSEKQLNPRITLLLAHDLLLAKRGLALSSKHGLYVAVHRHKARLSAELTKARLIRGFATLDALKVHIDSGAEDAGLPEHDSQTSKPVHPRWIRINTLLSTLQDQLISTFAAHERLDRLSDLTDSQYRGKGLYVDEHIQNLIAIRPDLDITKSAAYKEGKLIFQDKASCFPAYLIDPNSLEGNIIDACAAPGNKTTHLAALVSTHDRGKERKIIACERDGPRSETLAKMVEVAGAKDIVRIKAKQDFLRLDPQSPEFRDVTALLLDPSCSGSGIVGRDEASVNIRLPQVDVPRFSDTKDRKRKRNRSTLGEKQTTEGIEADGGLEEVPVDVENGTSQPNARLEALASFQLRLLEHAMMFPSAKQITYSTCSTYNQENEHVVVKALLSNVAMTQGWKILRRKDQVEGLQKWHRRGRKEAVAESLESRNRTGTKIDADVVADACIRCDKKSEDGTMGFFVAGFCRAHTTASNTGAIKSLHVRHLSQSTSSEDEWEGFSDIGK